MVRIHGNWLERDFLLGIVDAAKLLIQPWQNTTNLCLNEKMSKTKKPTSKLNPKTEKIPRQTESYRDHTKVLWSFSIYDSAIVFPKANIPNLEFSSIANQLKNIETRTWQDIDNSRDRDHPIEVSRLAKFAQARLKEIFQDDIDELWSIHTNGVNRIWGIRDRSLFKLLWIDSKHEVYPTRRGK